MLAIVISKQATAVEQFVNWMASIRICSQISRSTHDTYGTKEVLQRFADSLMAKVARHGSDYDLGLAVLLPHLVSRENLTSWCLSDSTDPALHENLYSLISLGAFTAFG